MNITIVGAGNIGTQFAVHCAEKLHNVIVYGSKPQLVNRNLVIVDGHGNVIHKGQIYKATDNAMEAFANADLIFITMPSYCMEQIANVILPFASPDKKICIVPGCGGAEWAFEKCVSKGAVLFGLQRVPSVARLVEYGKKVKAIGYRNCLYVAAIPNRDVKVCAQIIEAIFDITCVPMPNYLNLTLTPSNPVIHTSRLRLLFKNYKEGYVYDRIPLFYEEWTDEASELLLNCDDEVHKICRAFNTRGFDLSYVKTLRVHYESDTAQELTNKFKSIEGFKGLKCPMLEITGGYIPDFDSRYFTEDFSYGLSIFVQMAQLMHINVPYMQDNMSWYHAIIKHQKSFEFRKYGIDSEEKLVEMYLQ